MINERDRRFAIELRESYLEGKKNERKRHELKYYRQYCIMRARGICQECNKDCLEKKEEEWKKIIGGRERLTGWKTMEVHHITSRKDGGDNSRRNVIALCKECHKEKRGRGG